MIDLTPLEVRQKKDDFRRVMRGYDPELVNDFLDLVADRMEELVKENMVLRDSVGASQDELTDYRRKEQALSDALMSAQKLREEAREHAEKEGDLLLREARLAAERLRQDAIRQMAREEEALRQVRARRAQLVESFRRLLEREMQELDVIQETLELRASGETQLSMEGTLQRSARPSSGDMARPTTAPVAESAAAAGTQADRPHRPGGGEGVVEPIEQVEPVEPVEPALDMVWDGDPLEEATADVAGEEEASVPGGDGERAEKGKHDKSPTNAPSSDPVSPDGEETEEGQDDWLSSLMKE